MILYDAVNIKAGSEQVIEVRAGTELVWSFSDLWTFDTPTRGEQIQLIPTFSGSVNVHCGDGDTDTMTNNVSINHIY